VSLTAYGMLAAMLVTYALLDGYDLGVGTMVYFFARTDEERGKAIAAIGPFWNGNEVWLIAAGGVLFAFFPRAYASAFSGFYLPFMVVLWLLMFRGIALELRHQYEDEMWHGFWDVAFAVSSALLALILGVALGNLLGGLPLDATGYFQGSFALLLNPYALAVGIFALLALAQHGLCFLGVSMPEVPRRSAVAQALWWTTLAFYIVVTVATLATHLLTGPKLYIAGSLGGVELMLRRHRPLAAFGASCAFIVALLGAAVATLFPYLIPSSTSAHGISLFDAVAGHESYAAFVAVVAIALVVVYAYQFAVYRRLLSKRPAVTS
jgi:cytochrome d ubiquinol oxidase subunit II